MIDNFEDVIKIPHNVKPGQEVFLVKTNNSKTVTTAYIWQIIFENREMEAKIKIRKHGEYKEADFGKRIFLKESDAYKALGIKEGYQPEYTAKLIEKHTLSSAVMNLVATRYGRPRVGLDIAKEIGISNEQYHRIAYPSEYRSENIDIMTVIKIAEHFGTTVEELMAKAKEL